MSVQISILNHRSYDNSPLFVGGDPQRRIELPPFRREQRFSTFMKAPGPVKQAERIRQAIGIDYDLASLRHEGPAMHKGKVGRAEKKKSRQKSKASTPVSSPCAVPLDASQFLLPPQSPERTGMPTLVLDLDMTLLFSTPGRCASLPQLPNSIQPAYFPDDGMTTRYRAHLLPFLQFCKDNFEVIVWSAGDGEYVRSRLEYCHLIDQIDYVLTRDSCFVTNGTYVKNLFRLGRNIQNIILLDDNFCSCLMNVPNTIPVKKFSGQEDDELLQLVILLRKILQYQTCKQGIEK